jgi:hypothetical protein
MAFREFLLDAREERRLGGRTTLNERYIRI